MHILCFLFFGAQKRIEIYDYIYIYMFGSIFLAGKRLYQQFMLFGSFFGPYSKHIFGHILQIYLAMFCRLPIPQYVHL